MQRNVSRLLLLLIGAALTACSSTTEQGSAGVETEQAEAEVYDISPSTVESPPPEPETVQFTEAELEAPDLGPIETETETITYTEEDLGDSGPGVSAPEEFEDEQLEFPVTTYEIDESAPEESAPAEVTDLGAIETPAETLTYAEEYVPDSGTGVSAPEEYTMEEEVSELGPVATTEETMTFPEEPLYEDESVGDVTTYESVTVNAEARPLFAFDKSDVRPQEQYKLESFVSDLAGAEFDTIWVVGHADRIGTTGYNQLLSERRAYSVKAFLVNLGLGEDQISASGRGETMPVTTDAECSGLRGNALIECFQPDRRVEVSVSAQVVQEISN
ncbi:MAG: OmpA family protein [Burkholderiales bacterium]|jgi:outer membrane protein OmpA-like peptidoglycan-associated protein